MNSEKLDPISALQALAQQEVERQRCRAIGVAAVAEELGVEESLASRRNFAVKPGDKRPLAPLAA